MSTELLVAILGRPAVERMAPDHLQELVGYLDEGIMADPILMEKLREVVAEALARANDTVPTSVPEG